MKRRGDKVIKFSQTYLREIPEVDLGEILLRKLEYEDYKDMYLYGSDDEVTKTLLWDTYPNIERAEYAVKEIFLKRPEKGVPSAYAIVYKETNQMIGTCDFFRVDWNNAEGEIGYVLNRHFWGRGYMTLACKALIDFGFDYLKLQKINIGHMVGNIGSRRVIEKCGFRFIKEEKHHTLDFVGKFYEMTKQEYDQMENEGNTHYLKK